jgi:hypothetical protein
MPVQLRPSNKLIEVQAEVPRSLLGSNNMSVADANNETPATASPPYKLPVF